MYHHQILVSLYYSSHILLPPKNSPSAAHWTPKLGEPASCLPNSAHVTHHHFHFGCLINSLSDLWQKNNCGKNRITRYVYPIGAGHLSSVPRIFSYQVGIIIVLCNDFGVLPKDCSKFLLQHTTTIHSLLKFLRWCWCKVIADFGVSSVQSLERSCRSESINFFVSNLLR